MTEGGQLPVVSPFLLRLLCLCVSLFMCVYYVDDTAASANGFNGGHSSDALDLDQGHTPMKLNIIRLGRDSPVMFANNTHAHVMA